MGASIATELSVKVNRMSIMLGAGRENFKAGGFIRIVRRLVSIVSRPLMPTGPCVRTVIGVVFHARKLGQSAHRGSPPPRPRMAERPRSEHFEYLTLTP